MYLLKRNANAPGQVFLRQALLTAKRGDKLSDTNVNFIGFEWFSRHKFPKNYVITKKRHVIQGGDWSLVLLHTSLLTVYSIYSRPPTPRGIGF